MPSKSNVNVTNTVEDENDAEDKKFKMSCWQKLCSCNCSMYEQRELQRQLIELQTTIETITLTEHTLTNGHITKLQTHIEQFRGAVCVNLFVFISSFIFSITIIGMD